MAAAYRTLRPPAPDGLRQRGRRFMECGGCDAALAWPRDRSTGRSRCPSRKSKSRRSPELADGRAGTCLPSWLAPAGQVGRSKPPQSKARPSGLRQGFAGQVRPRRGASMPTVRGRWFEQQCFTEVIIWKDVMIHCRPAYERVAASAAEQSAAGGEGSAGGVFTKQTQLGKTKPFSRPDLDPWPALC